MRASFFLVLAVALLVGLGVAVAAKAFGLLSPVQIVEAAPPAPAPVVAPPPPPSVLVSARNIYEGDTIRPGDVKVRPARPEEIADLEKHKSEYVQPVMDAVYYRYALKNIEADAPILRSALKDLSKPEALHTRLAPGMRAVNVAVPKGNSAGGLIQVGDWIDLYVTTEVARTDETSHMPQTGLLVRHAQVIAKRDTLWSVFAPLPNETAIQYTLAMNPYRAALVEYTRTVGGLSMIPVSEMEKKKLDEVKAEVMKDPAKSMLLAMSDPKVDSYKDEESRIREYERGSLSIGADDLARVLNLKPIVAPTPVPPPPPAPAPLTVEVITGVQRGGIVTFPSQTPAAPAPTPPAPPAGRYLFSMPPTNGNGNGNGKTNGNGK